MKYVIFLFLTLTFLFSQDVESVSITTTDGSEIVGTITDETEADYTIETSSGIKITIPKESVAKIDDFKGKMKDGKLYRPDPNKSMYLFSPSAFPIGKDNKYCRDFCVFFPSINYGINEIFSLQAGFIWIPSVELTNIPLIMSIKTTAYQKEKFGLAAGAMYVRVPDFEETGGGGFIFATGTFGDRFNHGSLLVGWGYIHYDGNWELMDRPIVVLAGNFRVSNNFAIVTENWFPPELEFGQFPFMIAGRFFGKRLAVDIGAIIILDVLSDGLPIPLINFTYHF